MLHSLRLGAAILMFLGALAAQQVQELNGTWGDTAGSATEKVPASDFGEATFDGVEYFVWEVGNKLYRVKKADLNQKLRPVLQKGADNERRAILVRVDGKLTGGAAL